MTESTSSPALQMGDFSGWVSKAMTANTIKVWKERFFVLKGTELYYFAGLPSSLDKGGRALGKSPISADPAFRGFLHLHTGAVAIQAGGHGKRPHVLHFTHMAQRKDWLLALPTAEEAAMWCRELQMRIAVAASMHIDRSLGTTFADSVSLSVGDEEGSESEAESGRRVGSGSGSGGVTASVGSYSSVGSDSAQATVPHTSDGRTLTGSSDAGGHHRNGEQLSSAAGLKQQKYPSEYVRSLFAYEGESADDLSFAVDELILVLAKDMDTGWYLGTLQGRVGIFPSSFTEHM